MLTWIPYPIDGKLDPPPDLVDFQQAWFWNLLRASLRMEPQGYLPVTPNLWAIAGAHRREMWENHSSAVVAAFELEQVAGKAVLFFPPLIEVLQQQENKLRTHRKRGGFSQSSTEMRVSLSSLGFDSSKKKLTRSNARARGEQRELDFSPPHELRKPVRGVHCERHENSGLTQWGSCWACYAEKYGG